MANRLIPTVDLSTKVEKALLSGTVLSPLQIIKFIYKTDIRYLSAEQKSSASDLWVRLHYKKTLGSWTIIYSKIVRPDARLLCRCRCGFEDLVGMRNVILGKSKGCRRCGFDARMLAT